MIEKPVQNPPSHWASILCRKSDCPLKVSNVRPMVTEFSACISRIYGPISTNGPPFESWTSNLAFWRENRALLRPLVARGRSGLTAVDDFLFRSWCRHKQNKSNKTKSKISNLPRAVLLIECQKWFLNWTSRDTKLTRERSLNRDNPSVSATPYKRYRHTNLRLNSNVRHKCSVSSRFLMEAVLMKTTNLDRCMSDVSPDTHSDRDRVRVSYILGICMMITMRLNSFEYKLPFSHKS